METKIIFINDELISHKKELENCKEEINELIEEKYVVYLFSRTKRTKEPQFVCFTDPEKI